MTRHQGFDVRVAPEVERALDELAEGRGSAVAEARHAWRALRQLRAAGTWGSDVRKMRPLDLWEIRAGDHRLFFCQVRATRLLAVGAIVRKSRRRLPMRQLKRIEAKVQRWCTELEEMA